MYRRCAGQFHLDQLHPRRQLPLVGSQHVWYCSVVKIKIYPTIGSFLVIRRHLDPIKVIDRWISYRGYPVRIAEWIGPNSTLKQ